MQTVTKEQVRQAIRDHFGNQDLCFIPKSTSVDWIDLKANDIKLKDKPDAIRVEIQIIGEPRANSIELVDEIHPRNASQRYFKSLDVLKLILPVLLPIATVLPAPTSPPSDSDDPVIIIAELRKLLLRILKTC